MTGLWCHWANRSISEPAPPSGKQSLTRGKMNTSEVLLAAAELVEQGWTQDAFARDIEGNAQFDVCATGACCFCADGAIRRALNYVYISATDDDEEMLGLAIAALDRVIDPEATEMQHNKPFGRVHTWNDAPGRTQAEVVAKLREAAENAS